MAFEETKDERLSRETHETRDKIINHIKEYVENPTEANLANFLRKNELPSEFYKEATKSPEYLWYVNDVMPLLVSKAFKYNLNKYYLKKPQKAAKAKKLKKAKEFAYA